MTRTWNATESAIPMSGSSRIRRRTARSRPRTTSSRSRHPMTAIDYRTVRPVTRVIGPSAAPSDGSVDRFRHPPDLRDHLGETVGLERLRAVGQSLGRARVHLDDETVGA